MSLSTDMVCLQQLHYHQICHLTSNDMPNGHKGSDPNPFLLLMHSSFVAQDPHGCKDPK